MSLLEVNNVTSTNTKLLSGCGDGVRNVLHHPEKGPKRAVVRAPVPSCRRFATRPPAKKKTDQANVKVQLQKAIEELSTHPNITIKRASSMAEITPTRSLTRNMDGLSLSSPKARGAGGAKAAPSSEEDAGRRVCQLLLLNAWRRRRTHVATLTDSLATLETQNNNLERQIDALRRLRLSECEKRNEAVAESQRMQSQTSFVLKEKKTLIEEKRGLENQLKILQQREQKLLLDVQNVRNDWITVRSEAKTIEHQLDQEREKINQLREEKDALFQVTTQKDQHITALHDQIEDLQERLLATEISLQDTILSNNTYEDDMKVMLVKMSTEVATNTELEKKLGELTASKEKLETKVQEFRKSVHSNKESTKKLEAENLRLQKDLAEVKVALKEVHERPWWKNAGEFALAPLSALQSAAYIMLPALPSNVSRTTSTSDLPGRV